MNNFKVIEVIDAVTIRVEPKWSYTFPHTKQRLTDDKVKMAGFNVDPRHKLVKKTVTTFLLNRGVDLVNPVKIENNPAEAIIECKVLIDGTDLTIYFPELRIKSIAENINPG